MSLPSFYTLLNTSIIDQNQVHFSVNIEHQHPLYDGHFKNMPVVPGAMMVKIIKELLSGYFQKNLTLTSSKDIKFTALIEPNNGLNLDIEITYKQTAAQIETKILVKNGDVVCIKMSGNYKEALA